MKTAELSLDEAAALGADASIRPVAASVGAAALDELLPLLYKQVRSLAGPRTNLDDLVQAAAERALKALPNFEGRSAFSTWTYSIAYRTVQDHDRWYRRWTRRFAYDDPDSGIEPECPREGTETRVLQARRAKRLYHHLEALPANKRAVIVLHDLEELSVREIAEITDAGEATVRSRLRDGRKKLGELLASDPLFNPDAEEEP
ncbi:MAG: RNA polymerase sigma factor [Polyangiaceae bacterium]